TGTNYWAISSDLNSIVKVEVLVYYIKFVTVAITNDSNSYNVAKALNASEPETNNSRDSEHSVNEEIDVSNRNRRSSIFLDKFCYQS
ncbi:5770_t:CDS:1, partial [Gigaspora margarita]